MQNFRVWHIFTSKFGAVLLPSLAHYQWSLSSPAVINLTLPDQLLCNQSPTVINPSVYRND
jgi:hypothetical protein